jgi:hypothetical protein
MAFSRIRLISASTNRPNRRMPARILSPIVIALAAVGLAKAEPDKKVAPGKPWPLPISQPISDYEKAVRKAIGERWVAAVRARVAEFNTLQEPKLDIVFTVNREGKVIACKRLKNTGNEAFGELCEKAIRETPLEKPPEKELKDGVVEYPVTFCLY